MIRPIPASSVICATNSFRRSVSSACRVFLTADRMHPPGGNGREGPLCRLLSSHSLDATGQPVGSPLIACVGKVRPPILLLGGTSTGIVTAPDLTGRLERHLPRNIPLIQAGPHTQSRVESRGAVRRILRPWSGRDSVRLGSTSSKRGSFRRNLADA